MNKKILLLILQTFMFVFYFNTSSAQAIQNNCPNLKFYQSIGSSDKNTNGETTQLQRFLKQNLKLGDDQFLVTGVFGRVTTKFVKQFQANQNLYVSGQVGTITRAKILQICNPINTPSATTTIPNTTSTTTNTNAQTQSTVNQTFGAGGDKDLNLSYSWKTGDWSTCTNSSQSRQVSCYSSTNVLVVDNFCANINKPSTTQSCLSEQTQNDLDKNKSGWDYNLTKKCAKTTGSPGDKNYYEFTDQCSNSNKQWSFVVESENAPGNSAPGPGNRSFPINASGSPITVAWLPHASSLGPNWSVHMKVDQNTYPHPNGNGYFTYLGMMDHLDLKGGPLPAPLNLNTEHALVYSSWTPGLDDAARMLVGAQFFWDGKAHMLEINTASTKWGDADPDPEAIIVKKDWYGNNSAEYVVLDGAAFGITTPTGSTTQIKVPWGKLLNHVIQKGWFSPIGTLPNVTQAVYIGVETKNTSVADLWHTDFRVSSSTLPAGN